MGDPVGNRLERMRRGYRRLAAVVAAIVGVTGGFAFKSFERDGAVATSISLWVIGAVILGGGTYLLMLGVLAVMQGRAVLGGSKGDDSEERKGRGS